MNNDACICSVDIEELCQKLKLIRTKSERGRNLKVNREELAGISRLRRICALKCYSVNVNYPV